MNEKLSSPCAACIGSGLRHGAVCSECRGKGYRLILNGRQPLCNGKVRTVATPPFNGGPSGFSLTWRWTLANAKRTIRRFKRDPSTRERSKGPVCLVVHLRWSAHGLGQDRPLGQERLCMLRWH